MAITMIVVWGGLIWLAVTLIRRNNHTPHPQAPGATPTPSTRQTSQEILAERLARGEIEPDDYRQRLSALKQE
jgi:putative membrane protein